MKRRYLKLTAAVFALSLVMLSACGNKSEDKKDAEIQTIDSNEITSTEEAGFDGSYQISLLKKDCWIDKMSSITYYFSEDMNFTAKTKDDEKKGTYSVTGSDGYPILELKYDDNIKKSYIMLFNSEKSLTLTDSGTNKTYQLVNEKEKEIEEESENKSSSYSVNFETMENTNVLYPVISGWKQEDAQEKYNAEFKSNVQSIIDDADTPDNVSFNFEIKYMDDNTLSIAGKGDVYSMGAAHPYSVVLCYNIDMQSGEEISIADKIDVNSSAENFFNKKDCESVSDEITLDDILDVSMFESAEDVSLYMNETKYFYIDEDGKICVYFEVPYVLGGYAAVKFD